MCQRRDGGNQRRNNEHCRERPRRHAAEQRDELASFIKKTRSHGTIPKRVGSAKRLRSLPGSAESRWAIHSNTSSARPDKGSGTVMPSALAVFRFRKSSTLVDC